MIESLILKENRMVQWLALVACVAVPWCVHRAIVLGRRALPPGDHLIDQLIAERGVNPAGSRRLWPRYDAETAQRATERALRTRCARLDATRHQLEACLPKVHDGLRRVV